MDREEGRGTKPNREAPSPAESEPLGVAGHETDVAHREPWEQLLRAVKAAALCDVSVSTWWRMDASGRIPRGIKLSNGTKRWSRRELLEWIGAGCPARGEWENRTR